MSEEAKATQEVARATKKAIDRLGQMGGWLDRVFGDLVENGVGVVADKIKYYRIEKALLLRDKVERRLSDKGISATIPVPPRIGVKLIEEATVADSDELHSKWANLLTNAMDPKFAGKVTRRFVSILADLEPIDARILDVVVLEYGQLAANQRATALFDKTKVSTQLPLLIDECEVALRNLMRLGLIKPGVITGGVSVGDHALGSYKDTELFAPTLLGVQFHKAVN